MTVPPGKAPVGIDNPATMVRERFTEDVCAVGDVASVILTVSVLVPAAVGVPLITPVAGSTASPAGRPVTDHV